MFVKKLYYLILFLVFGFFVGCKYSSEKIENRNEYGLPNCPSYCAPQIHPVNTLANPPLVDGLIEMDEWKDFPWSSSFISEIKNESVDASYITKFKLARTEDSLYFSAVVFDKHIWAINDICQSYFFDDNFLELYIDIDHDEFDYVIIKMNALGNLCGEYKQRNEVKPSLKFSLLDKPHARCAVHIEGTVNNPTDLDEYWSVECAIPLNLQIDSLTLLKPKDVWNVNVQRTHWPSVIVSGLYKKMLNPETGKKYPGEKWVWSYLDENSINTPELWGEWHFNQLNQTHNELNRFQFERQVRWELRNIYYAQKLHYKKHHRYARKIAGLKDIGLKMSELLYKPDINARRDQFEAIIIDSATRTKFIINQDGKVWEEKN